LDPTPQYLLLSSWVKQFPESECDARDWIV
jgi:hypothetical protein